MHRWLGAAVLLFGFSATGCAAFLPEGAPERPVALGGTTVVVVFDHAPRELPFNPRNARLTAASQQLEARLGHPVQIQLDAALLPQWVDNFENGLASGIENVVRGLDWLQRTHPRVSAWAAPRLRRIACHYDAAARFSKATFDDVAGELRVDSPALPQVKQSVQANAAAIALLDEDHVIEGVTPRYYGPYLEQRFATVSPEAAEADELPAYWDYVDRRSSGFYRPGFGAPRPDLAHDPRATVLELAARLEPRVADPELAARVRERLVEGAGFFGASYLTAPDDVRSAPPGSPFRRGEAAYSAWLQRHAAGLTEAQQIALVRARLFVPRPYDRSRPPGTPRFFEAAFPGFDALGYALGVADRWIAAGHPSTPELRDGRSLFRALLCPIGRSSEGTLTTGGSCDSFLHLYVQATPEARDRLVRALSARHDRALTETVFFHLIGAPVPDLLEMWRAVEPDAVEWRIATLTLADPGSVGEGAYERALHDESVRLWRQHPDRRGPVLYLLASFDQFNMIRDGLVSWTDFDRVFGAKISAAEYTSYLAQGSLAIMRAAGLWRALGAGFSRVEPLLPLLDAYLADPNLKGYYLPAPEGPLLDIASRLCSEHATADLALLHAYFEKRAATRPSDERRFGLLLDVTSPGRCEVASHLGRRR